MSNIQRMEALSKVSKRKYKCPYCDNRYDVNSDGFYEQTLRNKAFYGYFGKNNNFNLIFRIPS